VSFDVDRTRTLRGAVSGAIGALVWAIQQPLDKLIFASRYDDVELLGRALTRGGGWYPAGLVLHVQNGAVFGAAYANLAPLLPLPAVTRGPLSAVGEQLALWPLAGLSDRLHPDRGRLPALAGNGRAFAQGVWRHLLFGIVLGELERRLNAEPEPAPPEQDVKFSSNGHGSFERTVSVERAP
jgi:hypothetical protein